MLPTLGVLATVPSFLGGSQVARLRLLAEPPGFEGAGRSRPPGREGERGSAGQAARTRGRERRRVFTERCDGPGALALRRTALPRLGSQGPAR
jgi:hypothetical protein